MMSSFDIELVGKVGSMALIDRRNRDIDYNVIARLSRELRPGYIWVTSGAAEIGRIDYRKRNNGKELDETDEASKVDYASQGQTILMNNYRQFMDSRYSLRQILVEHTHFNDEEKREHLRQLLLRCPAQNAIPIINYNDPVSHDEIVKCELEQYRKNGINAVQCIDNDETASQIACLVKTRRLIIMTGVDGIYEDFGDKNTLVTDISGKDIYEVIESIEHFQEGCHGSSRKGANGAWAKLEYIKAPVKNGTEVFIANSQYRIDDIISGKAPSTRIGVKR